MDTKNLNYTAKQDIQGIVEAVRDGRIGFAHAIWEAYQIGFGHAEAVGDKKYNELLNTMLGNISAHERAMFDLIKMGALVVPPEKSDESSSG